LKICKNRPTVGAPPQDLFASGGWEFCPRSSPKPPIKNSWLWHCIRIWLLES